MESIPDFVHEYMTMQKHRDDMSKSFQEQKKELEKKIHTLEAPVKDWLASHPAGEFPLLHLPEQQRRMFGDIRAIRVRENEETYPLSLAVLERLHLAFFQQYFKEELTEEQIRQMAQLCTEHCWAGRRRHKRTIIYRLPMATRDRQPSEDKRKLLYDRIHSALRDATSDM